MQDVALPARSTAGIFSRISRSRPRGRSRSGAARHVPVEADTPAELASQTHHVNAAFTSMACSSPFGLDEPRDERPMKPQEWTITQAGAWRSRTGACGPADDLAIHRGRQERLGLEPRSSRRTCIGSPLGKEGFQMHDGERA